MNIHKIIWDNIQISTIKVLLTIILIHNKVLEIQKIQILILKNNCINQNITYGINNFLMDKQSILENGDSGHPQDFGIHPKIK